MRRSRAADLVRLSCLTLAVPALLLAAPGGGVVFTPSAHARQKPDPASIPPGHTVYQAAIGGKKATLTLAWKPGLKKVTGFYFFQGTPKVRYTLKGEMFKDGQLTLHQTAAEGSATLWLTREVKGRKEKWTGRLFGMNGAREPVVLERTLGKG